MKSWSITSINSLSTFQLWMPHFLHLHIFPRNLRCSQRSLDLESLHSVCGWPKAQPNKNASFDVVLVEVSIIVSKLCFFCCFPGYVFFSTWVWSKLCDFWRWSILPEQIAVAVQYLLPSFVVIVGRCFEMWFMDMIFIDIHGGPTPPHPTPKKKILYFEWSPPWHVGWRLSGEGCHWEYDGKNGEFENIDFRFPWLSDTSEMGFGHDVPFLNYSDRLPHPSDLCQPDRVRWG